MLLNCGVGEDSWESLGLQGDPTSSSEGRSVLSVHWKDWCWSWNSNTLPTWCEELTHLKRPWCWERLKAGEEGDDGGWDGWMASLTQWSWVWVDSWSWWWTERLGMLQFMGLQRVRHDWATELNLISHLKANIEGIQPATSSINGILQSRILEWVAIPFSRGSSWPRNQIQISCIAADSLPSEPPGKPLMNGDKSQWIHNRSQNHWFEDYKIQKWCLVFSLTLFILFYLFYV